MIGERREAAGGRGLYGIQPLAWIHSGMYMYTILMGLYCINKHFASTSLVLSVIIL